METPNLGYVGVFDVDGTLYTKAMEEGRGSPAALEAAQFVRDYFDEHGTFTVASAQTAEMLMSSEIHENSRAHGFARPAPKLGGVPGRRYYLKPESIAARIPFTDAKAIMSMGTSCYMLEEDWRYRELLSYRRRLGENWRERTLTFLTGVADESGEFKKYLAPIEFLENYESGKTNVVPLDFRIQFEFPNREAKDRLKSKIRSAILGLRQISELTWVSPDGSSPLQHGFDDVITNIRIVDESNERLGKFQIYLMPRAAAKEEMIDETLSVMSKGEMIENLLIAGDMYPDLRAGCFSGRALRATFVLVGGSPLAPYFDRSDERFGKAHAGESLEFITSNLSPTPRNGFFVYERAGEPMRLFVNGAVAYPGLTGPETIAAYLKDHRKPLVY